MKTFEDLQFKAEPIYFNSETKEHAVMNFDNGYGVSVITGFGSYSNKEKPYELAVLFNDALCYTTPVTNDVVGYLSPDDVTEIMKQIQEL